MEFLNNLKFITVIALSLALSAGLVDKHLNSNPLLTGSYLTY